MCRMRPTIAASVIAATALTSTTFGDRDDGVRDAEAVVRTGLKAVARERARRAPRSDAPGPSWSDIERTRALRRTVDDMLDAIERRRGGAGNDAELPEFSVSPGALQDDPPTVPRRAMALTDYAATGGSYAYRASIDYNGDGVVDDGDLARAAQNPVADLISLPFQNNLNIDVGELNHDQYVLNIQPVIPVPLGEDWNMITRTIVPVVYQPSLFPGDSHDFGLGDAQLTAFFAPAKPVGGWVIGAGPVLRVPSATDRRLGARKWAAGPSAVLLTMRGPWVVGGLLQQIWSFAGAGDRDVSELLVQPFVNYNIPDGKGWYVVTAPIITANWEAPSRNRWTVPLGGGVGRVFALGGQPLNVSLQGFYNVGSARRSRRLDDPLPGADALPAVTPSQRSFLRAVPRAA